MWEDFHIDVAYFRHLSHPLPTGNALWTSFAILLVFFWISFTPKALNPHRGIYLQIVLSLLKYALFRLIAHRPRLSKTFPDGKKENDNKGKLFGSKLAQSLVIFQCWGLFSNLKILEVSSKSMKEMFKVFMSV